MNINKFKNGGGNQFPPMSPGTYPAVCSGVIDIGTQSTEYNGEHKTQNQLILMFDFPTETVEIDGQQNPRCLSLKLTKSVHEKSALRKHLIAWRGRDFTEDELKDFELSRLLGVSANITVIQKDYNGKTYSNISAIGKPMKGTEQKATRKIYFDMQDTETYGAIEELPDWMVCLINKSAEAIATKWIFSKKQDVSKTTEQVDDATNDDVPF